MPTELEPKGELVLEFSAKYDASVARTSARYANAKLISMAKEQHDKAAIALTKGVMHVAKEGSYLDALRRSMDLKGKSFRDWTKSDKFWGSTASAYRYIQVARGFSLLPKTHAFTVDEAAAYIGQIEKAAQEGRLSNADLDSLAELETPEDLELIVQPGPPKTKTRTSTPSGLDSFRRRTDRIATDAWAYSDAPGFNGVVGALVDKLQKMLAEVGEEDDSLTGILEGELVAPAPGSSASPWKRTSPAKAKAAAKTKAAAKKGK